MGISALAAISASHAIVFASSSMEGTGRFPALTQSMKCLNSPTYPLKTWLWLLLIGFQSEVQVRPVSSV